MLKKKWNRLVSVSACLLLLGCEKQTTLTEQVASAFDEFDVSQCSEKRSDIPACLCEFVAVTAMTIRQRKLPQAGFGVVVTYTRKTADQWDVLTTFSTQSPAMFVVVYHGQSADVCSQANNPDEYVDGMRQLIANKKNVEQIIDERQGKQKV